MKVGPVFQHHHDYNQGYQGHSEDSVEFYGKQSLCPTFSKKQVW
jgi:hypothetical protein